MTTTHILIDMDGVLADFFSPALARLNACAGKGHIPPHEYVGKHGFSMEKAFGITIERFWGIIDDGFFWKNLVPMPHAKRLLAALEDTGLPYFVASSPSQGRDCVPDKVAWLREHLGIPMRQCMFGSAKHLMARPGALLIDDLDKNCEAFIEAGGNAVCVPSNWNKADIRFEEDIWSKISHHLPL